MKQVWVRNPLVSKAPAARAASAFMARASRGHTILWWSPAASARNGEDLWGNKEPRRPGLSFVCQLARAKSYFAHHSNCAGMSYTPLLHLLVAPQSKRDQRHDPARRLDMQALRQHRAVPHRPQANLHPLPTPAHRTSRAELMIDQRTKCIGPPGSAAPPVPA